MNADSLALATDVLHRGIAGLQAAYLFGSRATGTFRTDSDWDIGILCPRVSPMDLASLSGHLSSLLGGDCDLVDLKRASASLRAEVLRTGRAFMAPDALALARFEMDSLTEYQNLNEHRKAILRDRGMAA